MSVLCCEDEEERRVENELFSLQTQHLSIVESGYLDAGVRIREPHLSEMVSTLCYCSIRVFPRDQPSRFSLCWLPVQLGKRCKNILFRMDVNNDMTDVNYVR